MSESGRAMVITTGSGTRYAFIYDSPGAQSGFVMRIPGPGSRMPGLDRRVHRVTSISPPPRVGGVTDFESSEIYMYGTAIVNIREVAEAELEAMWKAEGYP